MMRGMMVRILLAPLYVVAFSFGYFRGWLRTLEREGRP
jgi:hypothetical protein